MLVNPKNLWDLDWTLFFSRKNFFSLKKVSDHVSENDLYCVIRLI